ncbi:kinase-like domain-containing protein [Catenaria anguillulae PL171]|uniref:Kinase-like domain-containing protein n=1 Tax=Catenaria anguillulae PL171 TaxID=765915 RepID=A0A1Y2HDN5_9FUNG|nr:kinase-like domain-containing protein [Catenaria anguillulae PL171]
MTMTPPSSTVPGNSPPAPALSPAAKKQSLLSSSLQAMSISSPPASKDSGMPAVTPVPIPLDTRSNTISQPLTLTFKSSSASLKSTATASASNGGDASMVTTSSKSKLLRRFSWKKIKATLTGGHGHGHSSPGSSASPAASKPTKETPTARVEVLDHALPELDEGEDGPKSPIVLKTLRAHPDNYPAKPATSSNTSPTSSTTTATSTTHGPSRHGTPTEVEILAMLAAAKDRDPHALRHVVCPRDVYLNDLGEHVVVFDPLLELPLRDLPLRRAAELALQLFSALDAIHAMGIAHLDVNPSNIMQDAHGQLVLIDFGLARVCDGTPHPPGRGTRGYVAPELFPPKICHSTSPDMYSAGIVLGQMLDPYLAHCNVRILGGSASYPVHVEEVFTDVREFVEIDALAHDDLFPPILQLAADLLLRLITSSTPATPNPGHRYLRLTAAQAARHPWLQVLKSKELADKSFRYMTPGEWRARRAGQQLMERQRRRGPGISGAGWKCDRIACGCGATLAASVLARAPKSARDASGISSPSSGGACVRSGSSGQYMSGGIMASAEGGTCTMQASGWVLEPVRRRRTSASDAGA